MDRDNEATRSRDVQQEPLESKEATEGSVANEGVSTKDGTDGRSQAASPVGKEPLSHEGEGDAQEVLGEGAAFTDPHAEAEARIQALEQEKLELRDRMLRIAADFDNFKKRTRKELLEAEERGRETLLKELFPVIDNLERALSHASASEDGALRVGLVEGVRMVYRQFLSVLEKFDVKQFSALGEAFDPQYHMAVQQIETAEKPPGMVVEEYQKGYRVGSRLLRPAMVGVAAPPSFQALADTAEKKSAEEENAVKSQEDAQGSDGPGNAGSPSPSA